MSVASEIKTTSPDVDIVIPVYRNLDVTRACVESVLKSDLPSSARLIIIEDASPEVDVVDYCRQLSTYPNVEVLSHSVNCGFVVSVNEGMRLNPGNDVVLLNSDTRVANDWVQRLQRAAWSEEKIASVTPFSNNASICSFPLANQSNHLPADISLDELDKIFSTVNRHATADLPTAVGFCMYIRRDCINSIGCFDASSFGRGYGEENDFSLRAAEAGWRNIIAADVFVWHEGSISFGDDRHELMQHGESILTVRYPEYAGQVQRFIENDPLHAYRQAIESILLYNYLQTFATSMFPRFLFISHNWGGGVEQHIQDLLVGLHLKAVVMVLRGSGAGRLELSVHESSKPPFVLQVSDFGKNITSWISALNDMEFSRVHLHHIHGWQSELLLLLRSLKAPLDITLHDYWCVSPYYHLSPLEGLALDAVQEAGIDFQDWPLPVDIDWSEQFSSLLSNAQRLIAPSYDVVNRVRQFFPGLQIQVQQHPEEPVLIPSLTKVCLIGALSPAKGLRLLEAVSAYVEQNTLPLCFHLIGHAAEPLPSLVSHSGSYKQEDLGRLLAEARPDVIWLPSQVHETWGYTLTAAQLYGRPIVASAVGAFQERLSDWPSASLLAADADPADWIREILNAAQKSDAVDKAVPLRSLNDYLKFYYLIPDVVSAGDSEKTAKLAFSETSVISEPERSILSLFDVGVYGGHKGALEEVRRRLSELPDGETHVASLSLFNQNYRVLQAATEKLEVAEEYQDKFEVSEQQLHRVNDSLRQYKESLEREQHETAAARDAVRQYREALEYEQHENALKIQRYNDMYESLLNSFSWKITRPARALARGGRKSRAILCRAISLARSPAAIKRALHLYRRGGMTALRERFQQEVRTATAPAPIVRQDHVETHLLLNKHPVFSPLMLLTNEKPVLSIVIPVYGQHDTTYNCLASIAANPPSVSYEVIIADDASPEAAADALSMVQGIRIVRHPENLGFLGNSNAGVAPAKGEWLVLLNNDTLVCRNAFDALLNTFREYPAAGLVGAKLLNADGSVQEAGGIIWRDGSGWNWGRNQHRDDPRLNYVRDADYCSGAVLAMRRDLFADMGGFDTHFAPAYYEDTDLAFRIRQRGMRVLYQPAAEVYHLEGVSHGRDTNSGMKAWQVVNAGKFYQRWQSVLAGHRENAHQPELEAHRGTRGNILIIEACMITPDQDSGSIRMLNLLDLLRSQGYHVTFIADNLEYVEKYVHQLQQKGIEVYHTDWANGSVKSVLKQLGSDLDAVLVCRHYILKNYIDLLRELAPKAKVIFDTVDLHFVREEREAQLHQNAALRRASQITRRQELALVAKSDVTVVVSEFEKKLLADLLPQAKVEIISNIHNHEPQRPPYHEREGIIFVGGFRHPPNIDAITWYANDVLPVLRKLLPGVSTKVVGSNMPDTVRNLAAADLEMLGFIENIDPLLHAARISIAPLRYGAGVKGKVNEAMNYGIPVVATACAVEGMHLRAGEEVMVAESAEEFAKAIVAAYQDATLWQQLSNAGVENVKQHFSPAAALPALERILHIGQV